MYSNICDDCPCWKSETGGWFLDIPTSEWDNYNDDFVHINTPISYCPYTGKELRGDTVCGYN